AVAAGEAAVEQHHVLAGVDEDRREAVHRLVARQVVGGGEFGDGLRALVHPESWMRSVHNPGGVEQRCDLEAAELETVELRRGSAEHRCGRSCWRGGDADKGRSERGAGGGGKQVTAG